MLLYYLIQPSRGVSDGTLYCSLTIRRDGLSCRTGIVVLVINDKESRFDLLDVKL